MRFDAIWVDGGREFGDDWKRQNCGHGMFGGNLQKIGTMKIIISSVEMAAFWNAISG